jgi:biopolymer transport protein ExbD
VRLKRHEAKKGRIEIIPMIDVVFFLLVFSMLSALSMAEINRLNAEVPKTGSGQGGEANRITVNLINNKLFLTYETPYRSGQQPLSSPSQITSAVEAEYKRNRDVVVLVNVKDDESFDRGAELIDAVKGTDAPLVIPAGSTE